MKTTKIWHSVEWSDPEAVLSGAQTPRHCEDSGSAQSYAGETDQKEIKWASFSSKLFL